jgi:hypothetical protein
MTYPLLILALAATALVVGCAALIVLRYRLSRWATVPSTFQKSQSRSLTFPTGKPAATFLEAQTGWARASGLALRDAEELLDWLENEGYKDNKLICESEQSFAVEFRKSKLESNEPTRPK